MFCPRCGGEVPEGAESCSRCGAPAPQASATAPPPSHAYAPAPTTAYAPGETPAEIKGFNLGAFSLYWVWAFAHRLYFWGVIGLLFWIIPVVGIIPGLLGIGLYLGFKGNGLAWKSRSFQSVQQFKDTQRTWAIVGAIMLGARVLLLIPILILTAVAVPNFMRARAKANYTATVEQLKNIASGMEQEISESGSLANVTNEDDVCHHILPGFDKASDCPGLVKGRFDEIGVPGSLEVTTDNNFQYEIRGQAKDHSQCNICITERAVRPEIYNPAGGCAAYECVH